MRITREEQSTMGELSHTPFRACELRGRQDIIIRPYKIRLSSPPASIIFPQFKYRVLQVGCQMQNANVHEEAVVTK